MKLYKDDNELDLKNIQRNTRQRCCDQTQIIKIIKDEYTDDEI